MRNTFPLIIFYWYLAWQVRILRSHICNLQGYRLYFKMQYIYIRWMTDAISISSFHWMSRVNVVRTKPMGIRTTWDFDKFSHWPRNWTVDSLGLQNKSFKRFCSGDIHCEIFSSSVWHIGQTDVVRWLSSLRFVIVTVMRFHVLARAQRWTAGKRPYSWQLYNQNK